jgi:hypothetical protein
MLFQESTCYLYRDKSYNRLEIHWENLLQTDGTSLFSSDALVIGLPDERRIICEADMVDAIR